MTDLDAQFARLAPYEGACTNVLELIRAQLTKGREIKVHRTYLAETLALVCQGEATIIESAPGYTIIAKEN